MTCNTKVHTLKSFVEDKIHLSNTGCNFKGSSKKGVMLYVKTIIFALNPGHKLQCIYCQHKRYTSKVKSDNHQESWVPKV